MDQLSHHHQLVLWFPRAERGHRVTKAQSHTDVLTSWSTASRKLMFMDPAAPVSFMVSGKVLSLSSMFESWAPRDKLGMRVQSLPTFNPHYLIVWFHSYRSGNHKCYGTRRRKITKPCKIFHFKLTVCFLFPFYSSFKRHFDTYSY